MALDGWHWQWAVANLMTDWMASTSNKSWVEGAASYITPHWCVMCKPYIHSLPAAASVRRMHARVYMMLIVLGVCVSVCVSVRLGAVLYCEHSVHLCTSACVLCTCVCVRVCACVPVYVCVRKEARKQQHNMTAGLPVFSMLSFLHAWSWHAHILVQCDIYIWTI